MFAKLRKANIHRVSLSIRLSAWNNSAPTGRIFMKFCIWIFFESLSRKFKFLWVWQYFRLLYMMTYAHLWYLDVLLWLRCCATNRNVAGSIPACVIGIFYRHNTSDRTMALGSTQPLTEMSTRSISWGWERLVREAENLTTILGRCHVFCEP